MVFHLLGYSESQDSAVLVPTAALADPSLTVSGDNVQVPVFADMLFGYAAIGANATRAQVIAPSLRRTINPEIRPLNVDAEPLVPFRGVFFPANPIQLDIGEQLSANMAEDAAGASRVTILVFLSDAPITPIGGEIFSVRVTNADTLTAFAWTNGALTFDQTLPVGNYGVVGAKFESAGLLAFRFLFQGSTPRPGGIGGDAAGDSPPDGQRLGGWGVWGEFDSRTPPTVDFLSVSADTSQVGTLDLVRL